MYNLSQIKNAIMSMLAYASQSLQGIIMNPKNKIIMVLFAIGIVLYFLIPSKKEMLSHTTKPFDTVFEDNMNKLEKMALYKYKRGDTLSIYHKDDSIFIKSDNT